MVAKASWFAAAGRFRVRSGGESGGLLDVSSSAFVVPALVCLFLRRFFLSVLFLRTLFLSVLFLRSLRLRLGVAAAVDVVAAVGVAAAVDVVAAVGVVAAVDVVAAVGVVADVDVGAAVGVASTVAAAIACRCGFFVWRLGAAAGCSSVDDCSSVDSSVDDCACESV